MAQGQEGTAQPLESEGAPGPDPGRGAGASFGPWGAPSGRPLLAMSHEPRAEYNAKNLTERLLISRWSH